MVSTEGNNDPENPLILTTPNKQKTSFWQRSPVDRMMFTASGANMFMTCMFTYALSGNIRWAQFLSLFAIPITMATTIVDSKVDYDNWQKTQKYREKGLAEKFMPVKVKYDWSQFDAELKERNKPKFSGTSDE